MPKSVVLLTTLAVAFALVPHANTQAMPLGLLTPTSTTYSCTQARNSADFLTGMTCVDAQITNCPGVATLNLTFGYIAPSNPQGTIVLFSGGNGTAPTEDDDNNIAFANSYANKFQVIMFEWGQDWEDPAPSTNNTGGSILAAACRPATFLNYIYKNYNIKAFCAQGASAGAAALAYSMVWYGQAANLVNTEMLAGPVLSEIDVGCNPSSPQATMCSPTNYCSPKTGTWTVQETYVPDDADDINKWSLGSSTASNGCMSGTSSSGQYTAWQDMSIVDGYASGYTPIFDFYASPNTTPIHGWVCNSNTLASGTPNNSGSEGNFFYNTVFTAEGGTVYYPALEMTGTNACVGAEGVVQGTDPDTGGPEATAISTDMSTKCTQ
jgi:hypothetical protein